MERSKMTDKELLCMAYGAMRTLTGPDDQMREVVAVIEEHLFPSKTLDEVANRIVEDKEFPAAPRRGEL